MSSTRHSARLGVLLVKALRGASSWGALSPRPIVSGLGCYAGKGMMRLLAASFLTGVVVNCTIYVGPRCQAQPLPPPPQLNSWTFYGTNFESDLGYSPKAYTNALFVGTGFTNGFFAGKSAVLLDTTNTVASLLHYNAVESDGTTNLTAPYGTIALWISPNWASVGQGGSGPGELGYLFGAGRWDTNAVSLLALVISSNGSSISFIAESNSVSTNYLSVPISWSSNQAHFVCTAYSPTNCALFIDGQAITNGPGLTAYPDGNALTNGFYVGSDDNGLEQARGAIFGLQTWSSALEAGDITNLYIEMTTTNGGSGGPGTNAYTCTPGTLKFSVNPFSYVNGEAPVLGLDGSIIVGPDALGYMFSFNTNGGMNWQTNLNINGQDASPTVGDDGTIYYGSGPGGGGLGSVSSNGVANWFWTSNYVFVSSENCSLGLDGNIYICSDAAVIAISPGGAYKWAYKNPYYVTNTTTGVFSYCNTAVGPDGTIYVGGAKPTKLWAIHPNGGLKWIADTPVSSNNYATMWSCAIGADGTVYAGTQPIDGSPCYFMAFKGSGSLKWVYTNNTDTSFNSQPVIGPDGTIYVTSANFNVASNNTTLFAFNHDGSLKWTRTTLDGDNMIYGGGPTAAIADDGTVCIGSGAAYSLGSGLSDYTEAIVYGLSPVDGSEVWHYDTGNVGGFTGPVIGKDGTVYILNIDQLTLYAICGTAGPACSAWPELHRNGRHTSRIVPPKINSDAYTNGTFVMNLSGTNGVICDLCATIDFTIWTNIGTITLTNAGTNFIDTQASNFTRRFYRPLGE